MSRARRDSRLAPGYPIVRITHVKYLSVEPVENAPVANGGDI